MAKLTPLDTNVVPNLERRSRSPKVAVRCLFGSPNRTANMDLYERFMRKQAEEAQTRWNFDFINDCPLNGRYQWEKVLPVESPKKRGASPSPSLVKPVATPLTAVSPSATRALDFSSSECSKATARCPQVSANDAENSCVSKVPEQSTRRGVKRKHGSQITDYFTVIKRPSTPVFKST